MNGQNTLAHEFCKSLLIIFLKIIIIQFEYLDLLFLRLNLAPANPSIVLDLLRELKQYKETMVSSIRRKKIDLTPYLQDKIPTPIDITDPRNRESFFVGDRHRNDFAFDFSDSDVTERINESF